MVLCTHLDSLSTSRSQVYDFAGKTAKLFVKKHSCVHAVPPPSTAAPPAPPPLAPAPLPPPFPSFPAPLSLPTPPLYAQHTSSNFTEHLPSLPPDLYLDLLDSFTPQNAHCPTDTVVPTLRLLGPDTITTRPGARFVPPAAYCVDATHPAFTSFTVSGLTALQAALAGSNHASLGQLVSAGTHGPWILQYTAQDDDGNVSPAEYVTVYIHTDCSVGYEWCFSSGECMAAAACTLHTMIDGYKVPSTTVYTHSVDTTPPVLRVFLLPDDRVLSLGETAPVMIESWVVATGTTRSQYVDAGWVAFDNSLQHSDLTEDVSTLGLAAVTAAVAAGAPTATDVPLPIRYFVQDASGNSVEVLRAVHVVCAPLDTVCTLPSGATRCSVLGSCVLQEGEEAVDAATLELKGPEVVYVPQGQTYHSCVEQQPLALACDEVRLDSACCIPDTTTSSNDVMGLQSLTEYYTYTAFMQGAEAWHPIDGDITPYVDACQPEHRFMDLGICACGVNTSVVGNYTVSFFISDPRLPSGPSVTRTIVVHQACGSEEVLCSDLTCSMQCVSGELATTHNHQPMIYFPSWQQPHVYVPQGVPYSFCWIGEEAVHGDRVCEQGVGFFCCCCTPGPFSEQWLKFVAL